MEDNYNDFDNSIELNAEVYDTDFDEAGWEPEEVEDYNHEEYEEMFGLNK